MHQFEDFFFIAQFFLLGAINFFHELNIRRCVLQARCCSISSQEGMAFCLQTSTDNLGKLDWHECVEKIAKHDVVS